VADLIEGASVGDQLSATKIIIMREQIALKDFVCAGFSRSLIDHSSDKAGSNHEEPPAAKRRKTSSDVIEHDGPFAGVSLFQKPILDGEDVSSICSSNAEKNEKNEENGNTLSTDGVERHLIERAASTEKETQSKFTIAQAVFSRLTKQQRGAIIQEWFHMISDSASAQARSYLLASKKAAVINSFEKWIAKTEPDFYYVKSWCDGAHKSVKKYLNVFLKRNVTSF
jgi:hypothetical protein